MFLILANNFKIENYDKMIPYMERKLQNKKKNFYEHLHRSIAIHDYGKSISSFNSPQTTSCNLLHFADEK